MVYLGCPKLQKMTTTCTVHVWPDLSSPCLNWKSVTAIIPWTFVPCSGLLSQTWCCVHNFLMSHRLHKIWPVQTCGCLQCSLWIWCPQSDFSRQGSQKHTDLVAVHLPLSTTAHTCPQTSKFLPCCCLLWWKPRSCWGSQEGTNHTHKPRRVLWEEGMWLGHRAKGLWLVHVRCVRKPMFLLFLLLHLASSAGPPHHPCTVAFGDQKWVHW